MDTRGPTFRTYSFFIFFLLMTGSDAMNLKTFKTACSKLGTIDVHKYDRHVPEPKLYTPFKRFLTTDRRSCAAVCLSNITRCKTFLMVKEKAKYECQLFDISHRAFPRSFVKVSHYALGREVFCHYRGEFFQQNGQWFISSRERSSSYTIIQPREKLGLIEVGNNLKSEVVEDYSHCLVLSSNLARRGTFIHLKVDEKRNETVCDIFEQAE